MDDERLPEVEIPAGISCTWDEEGVLDQGDLLMAWSFLATNGEAICSPSLSLKDLCGGLLVAERALDLTDVHVALLRVLLLNMDTEMGQEYVTQPRRGDLLTNLTWPYMASMYLEESAHRLHGHAVCRPRKISATPSCAHAHARTHARRAFSAPVFLFIT